MYFKISILFCLIIICSGTLGPDDKKKKSNEIKKIKLAVKSVNERNLIKQSIASPKEIIKNNKKYCEPCLLKKNFKNKVLGYVTPWNSRGYDISKIFANKIDLISPVWLQIQRMGHHKYQLTGTHDIDKTWMGTVRNNSIQSISFVPRILFEKLKMEDIHALFNDEEEILSLVKMLVDKSNQFKFDGYVLEIYLQLSGQGKSNINHLVKHLADGLHSNNKYLIIVVPPPISKLDKSQKSFSKIFEKEDFDELKDMVDGFSLMTYDYYSHSKMIAPNAPIDWIEQNVLYFTNDQIYRSKILLGLNFYGMKFQMDYKGKPLAQPEPIIGRTFIDLLKNNEVNIKYDDQSKEHMFLMKEEPVHTLIFYPSLYSIQQRIELAERLGTGLSIWELGQGLDYFYDLL